MVDNAGERSDHERRRVRLFNAGDYFKEHFLVGFTNLEGNAWGDILWSESALQYQARSGIPMERFDVPLALRFLFTAGKGFERVSKSRPRWVFSGPPAWPRHSAATSAFR